MQDLDAKLFAIGFCVAILLAMFNVTTNVPSASVTPINPAPGGN